MPDEIRKLISKDKLEAAVAWFNARQPRQKSTLPARDVDSGDDSDSDSDDDDDGGADRPHRKSSCLERISWLIGDVDKSSPYVVSDTDIDGLVHCIAKYEAFVKTTGFRHQTKFANQFSKRHVYGLYAWIGHLDHADDLLPLLRFLSRLEEQLQEQMWASVPDYLKQQVVRCTKFGAQGLEGIELLPVTKMHDHWGKTNGLDLNLSIADDFEIGYQGIESPRHASKANTCAGMLAQLYYLQRVVVAEKDGHW